MSKPNKIIIDGREEWRLNGLLHREDGPAIIREDGTKMWCLNGLLHRENGSAVIRPNGYEEWRLNGKLHREDGPAAIWPDGYEIWCLNNKKFSFNEYKSWFISKISNPFYKLTDGDISFIKEYLE